MNNRRQHQRLQCSASAILRQETVAEVVEVVELSGGGARVAWSGEAVNEGSTLTLLFQTAPFAFHNCPAKVLRQVGGVVVLQFEKVLDEGVVTKVAA